MISLGLTLAAAVCNVRHQRRFWEGRDDRPDHPLLTPDRIPRLARYSQQKSTSPTETTPDRSVT